MADRRYDDDRRGQDDRRRWDPEEERRIQRRADMYRGSDERGYGGGERLGRRDWERGDPRDEEHFDRDARVRSYDEQRFDRGGRGGEERMGRKERGSREVRQGRSERRLRDLEPARDPRWRAERRGRDRDFDPSASPSGAFHDELRAERERPRRYEDRTRPTSLPYGTDRRSAGGYGLGAGEPGERGGGRDYERYGGDVGRGRSGRGRYGTGTRHFFGDTGHREEHGHSFLAGLHDLEDMSELRERYRESRQQRDYPPRYGHGPGVENMEAPRLGYGTSTTRSEDHELGHGGFLGGGTYRAGSPMPTGRGPKGYQRSDDRIREDICDRLMMSWMNAENVDVEVRNGEVTLKGTVKSRDEKRAIEALAESVLGVKDLNNALRVERTDQLRASDRPEPHGDKLSSAQGGAPAVDRRGQAQERRAQDQEQTSVKPPGNTPMHS